MFEDLYDAISFFWSKKWPVIESEITAIEVERIQTSRSKDRFRLAVAYKFSLGEDAPYTGISFWDPPRSQSEEQVQEAAKRLQVGQRIRVRYRPDNAMVNQVDPTVWQEI